MSHELITILWVLYFSINSFCAGKGWNSKQKDNLLFTIVALLFGVPLLLFYFSNYGFGSPTRKNHHTK